MNNLKKLLIPLSLGLILSSCTTKESIDVQENTQADSKDPTGYILVRERDVSVECSIPATVGDHAIDRRGCTNDQAYTVRFVNVPSALNITFFDDKKNDYCLDNEGWEIEVRTTKQPTTTDYINIEAMASIPNNAIIEPGLMKIRYRADGTIHGHLSCVRVENNK
ncbi:hypothetical protein [Pseudomonas sp. St290]|uniref:hypothetical protein n=1 Tax=Pseudomonas sp. St290 TaxID=1602166 RepID=UPI0013C346F3|nr:hypothetical protein [Pseudomonas sp. St290]BBH34847.1 putative lipoprotein [Pseudomonas sp. St290]